MTKLKIVQPPHPALRTVASKVKVKDKGLGKLVLDLVETLVKHQNPPGVGLSAPQVGICKRVFVARENPDSPIEVFINPEFTYMSDEVTTGKNKLMEGCLSLPGYYGRVQRAVEVEMKYQTVDVEQLKKTMDPAKLLEKKTARFKDFHARIMQHETDHLDGIMFTQRLLEQGEGLYELETDENGKEVFVEVEFGE